MSLSAPAPLSGEEIKRAQAAYSDDPLVRELCEANGLSREDFIHSHNRVETIELFLLAFPSLSCITWFPFLRELQVMHCEVAEIEGLGSCVNLERLWLNENSISRIQGLEKLTLLKELYLYNNNISKIENLERNTNLEVLWLMENSIAEIEGLEKLQKLRKLWLASNAIESIGNRLDANTALEDLNLAGNKIGSFREIPQLDRLPQLRSLSFSDPHFGENPVCQLCNYQTFTLYHLNRITKLDCLIITEEQRHVADATFVKKKMYYNMRIKTLKRNTNNALKRSLFAKQNKVNELNVGLNVLIKQCKSLEREITEQEYGISGSPDAAKSPKHMKDHIAIVQRHIETKTSQIESLTKQYEALRTTVQNISQHSIARLLVELQTGGNIRLEEGKPTDVWHKSCVDLVRTRFFPVDYEQFGIKDIKVTKVTRIHNRFLRNRFEDRLETLVDTSDPSYKSGLEYLFYGEDPELSGDMLRAVEEGFRPASEFEKLNKDGGIPLSNSVFICEHARLQSMMEKGLVGLRSAVRNLSPNRRDTDNVGRLLLTKVYLGKSSQERDGIPSEGGSAPLAAQRPSFVPLISRKGDAVGRVRRRDYSGLNSVYRVKVGDTKQRVWFAFDHHLVLPEYIVEFAYVSTPDSVQYLTSIGMPSGDGMLDEEALHRVGPIKSDIDASDMRAIAQPCLAFLNACAAVPIDTGREELLLDLPERPKYRDVTPELVQTITRAPDVYHVVYVNLFQSGIKKMEAFQLFSNLRVLILSFNEIQRIECVQDLPQLEHLDLSFNLIKRIDGLKGLNALHTLELNNNLLFRPEDIGVIKRCLPQLTVLNLANNALCEMKSYRWTVLRKLPQLQRLDGEILTADDKAAAVYFTCLTPDLILANAVAPAASPFTLTAPPMSPTDIAISVGSPDARFQQMSSPFDDDDDKFPVVLPDRAQEMQLAKVVEVQLPKLRLQKIQSFEKLRSLRKLNLADNELTRIEGLECCAKLEELNLEDNRLTRIEGLNSLLNLRKLELGKNKISKVEGLENMHHLCLLSVEDNEITSLSGFNAAPNLMEIYAGNNKIESIKEINNLRDLGKLIIVDLSGNGLCKDRDYRLYAVFNLKKLKVLDGVSVDAAENGRAKEAFAGKMTPELLTERVGPGVDWRTVAELNLSGCSLKELSLLENFESLGSLNLDNNALQELNGLQRCSSLTSVSISNNRFSAGLDFKSEHPQRNPVGKYLSALPRLQAVSLEGNAIQTVLSLQLRCASLLLLNLKGNDLSKIDGLDVLVNLRELNLEKNKLRLLDERVFAGLIHLRDLKLDENMLKSLDGLRNLINLQRLSVASNRVADLNEIDKIEMLTKLQELTLTGNSITRKSLYRATVIHKIPSVVICDGREVLPEEREKAEAFFNQEYYYQQHPPNVFTDRSQPFGSPTAQVTQGAYPYVQQQVPQPPPKPALKLANVTMINFDGQSDQILSVSNAPSTSIRAPMPNRGRVGRAGLMRTNSADSANSANRRKPLSSQRGAGRGVPGSPRQLGGPSGGDRGMLPRV
eukprot:TRINITY_DN2733_c0_g1_i1.p1 TRINITY_DN2733_c0_g1~~TRINITY_DN2733_c0_g1_i1.p1  ORF type:complete len:1527 (-),score=315.85 TRINITY_DN2733_c0_g1_i1:41-4621(-)